MESRPISMQDEAGWEWICREDILQVQRDHPRLAADAPSRDNRTAATSAGCADRMVRQVAPGFSGSLTLPNGMEVSDCAPPSLLLGLDIMSSLLVLFAILLSTRLPSL